MFQLIAGLAKSPAKQGISPYCLSIAHGAMR
jgi:hypothetical protein